MALNYSVQLQIYTEDGTSVVPNAKVHAYFNRVDSASSPSKWDGNIRLSLANGVAFFNLGDASFLTSEGLIKNGDQILITVWLADNNLTSVDDKSSTISGKILRCVDFVHTVNTSSLSWVEKIVLPAVKSPICQFTNPTVTNTGVTFTIDNSSIIQYGPYSYNIGNVNRADLYQNLSKFSQTLWSGRAIKETLYDLGESSVMLSGITDRTYTYIDAGVYTWNLRVYNYLGFYCETTATKTIKYNQPIISFDHSSTKLLNTDKHVSVGNDDVVTFTNLSNTVRGDTWAQLQASFDWIVTDTNLDNSPNNLEILSTDVALKPTKTFMTSGTKTATLRLRWNDGFDWFTLETVRYPIADVYNIDPRFHWETAKGLKSGSIWIPLGDDDLVTVKNDSVDVATQNYNSTSQWISLSYDILKKKNDGSSDDESFNLSKSIDQFAFTPQFYIKYPHTVADPAIITQTLVYWDGYKQVTKNLVKNVTTSTYTINHDWHWTTSNGTGKVIVHDADPLKLYSDVTFSPQNNIGLISESYWNLDKSKYASYTDDAILSDLETFTYFDANGVPSTFVKKPGSFQTYNRITYYDGYAVRSSTVSKTITAAVLTPSPNISWTSRLGANTYIQGRDDIVTFTNSSNLVDYYGAIYPNSHIRQLSVDWVIRNGYNDYNYSVQEIGGATWGSNNTLREELFTGVDPEFTPQLNYWMASIQPISIRLYYNDGYFNRYVDHSETVESRPYTDLLLNAQYTSSVPNRNSFITFKDASTNKEERIISEDWSLTDRYSDDSMTVEKRGLDNLQIWTNQPRLAILETTVNSNESHTLSQTARWDDGFRMRTFSKSYTITTTAYTINPAFGYAHIFLSGPEIRFYNTTTVNGLAIQLDYDLTVSDTDNSGNILPNTVYNTVIPNATVDHTYKSVSAAPHMTDVANKLVKIDVWYDNGWDRVSNSKSGLIAVKPNRITQNFLTSDSVMVGNRPISFWDSTNVSRFSGGLQDKSFIKHVKYEIVDECV